MCIPLIKKINTILIWYQLVYASLIILIIIRFHKQLQLKMKEWFTNLVCAYCMTLSYPVLTFDCVKSVNIYRNLFSNKCKYSKKGYFTQRQIHPQELPEDLLLEKSHNFIDIFLYGRIDISTKTRIQAAHSCLKMFYCLVP